MKIKLLTLVLATALLAAPESLAAPEAAPEVPAGATVEAPQMLPDQDGKVFLRELVIVNGKVVRLGDLFTNTGEIASTPVAYAPEPGKRAFFDANWLFRVAQAYKLEWRPLSIHDRIVVERDSIVIKREEIEDHILAALIDKNVGIDASMSVELGNRMLRLYVAGYFNATVSVEDVDYEPRTGRFTAIVAAPANDPGAQRNRVTGRVFKMTEVPVLTRRMLASEVITNRDIEWIKSRSNRVQNDTILSAEDLIGKAARRSLRAGTPVRTSDVRRPVLVPRGGLVTMVLRMPDMILTSQGKAMEEGSDGDTIRVTNTQSNTVIEAVVTGANLVTVRPTGHVAIN